MNDIEAIQAVKNAIGYSIPCNRFTVMDNTRKSLMT